MNIQLFFDARLREAHRLKIIVGQDKTKAKGIWGGASLFQTEALPDLGNGAVSESGLPRLWRVAGLSPRALR